MKFIHLPRRGRMLAIMLICLGGTVKAQNRMVNGKVMDSATHSPLENISVLLQGTVEATKTDKKGNFHLFVPATRGRLIISAAEYNARELDIPDSGYIEVLLGYSLLSLNDVVVIGYGSARRKDLTGSLSSVTSANFNKGFFTSPEQLIAGKVAGVQITPDNGQPGGAATIRIRGNSALSGTGAPLFVVDGIPLDGRSLQAGNNALNFINPDDIASIDILKDASATAIYGSRAAYGVVLINTKKGQPGITHLDIASSVGISSILKRIDVLNADQFRQALKYYDVAGDFDKGSNVNAFDSILQHGFQQNYTVALSGGNMNEKYRISGNLLDQRGIVKNTGLRKYGIDFAGNFKLLENKKLSLDVMLNTNQYVQNTPIPDFGMAPIILSALRWNPTQPLSNPDATYTVVDGTINPVAAVKLIQSNLKVTTVFFTVSPSYRITDWLEYKLLGSVNYNTGTTRSSENQDIVSPGNPPGDATIRNRELTTTQFTQTLTAQKEIAKGFHLSAVIGYEYTKFANKGYSLSGVGDSTGFGNFGIDYTNYIQYSSLSGRSIASYADPSYQLKSSFGRAIFNYRDRYLLTSTIRVDGSSKFGANKKYGYFPSFAAAWNLHNETFFKSDFVNTLKFRFGWGETGNQEFPAGSAQARYSFFDGGVLRLVNNPNPDLKWQSDRQWDIGIDFAILKNRISGTIDYFDKTTTNLIFPSLPIQPAPPDAAIRWQNLPGEIKNSGIELLIRSSLISSRDWDFNLGLNASFLKNTVTGLPATIHTGFISGPVQVIQNGYPMNTFYTREFLGIDKTTGFSNYADSGSTYYHFGSPNPKRLLGITPGLRFKKFALVANLYGAFGQNIFYTPLMAALNVGAINVGANIGTSVYENPEKESLANPSQSHSSRFIYKGNYFKLSNLTVNYRLGNMSNVVKDLNFSITAQNFFIWTKYPGFSPETNFDASINGIPSVGIDAPHYPSAKTILIGIRFSL